VYSTLALIFGHAIVLPNNTPLSSCLKAHNIPMESDTYFMVSEGEPDSYMQKAK
jgi:hypothetical protein